MAQDYDIAVKSLAKAHPEHLVQLALGPVAGALEAAQIQLLDTELPVLSRRVDFLGQVPVAGEMALLLVEFQTTWTATMPVRMAVYTTLLSQRYDQPVYAVVVVLRESQAIERQWRAWAGGQCRA